MDGGQEPAGQRAGPQAGFPVVPEVTDAGVRAEVEARRDRVTWRGWDALGVGLLYLLGTIPAYLLWPGALDDDAVAPPLVDSLVLLGSALLWLRLVRGGAAVRRAFGPRHDVPRLLPSLLLGAGVGLAWPLLDTALFALLEATGAQLPPIQEHLEEWVAAPATRLWVAVDIALLTPVAEELLFRGVLFQGLARRWGVGIAAVVSSLLFGLAHIESGGLDSVFMVASTFLFGLGCAWLLHRRRTLLAPIAAHVVTNAIGTAFLLAS